MKFYKNAKEYINDLIDAINEAESTVDDPLPSDLRSYWFEEIKTRCKEKYKQFNNNEEDDYRLDDEEITELLYEANKKLVADSLSKLVKEGVVKMSVGEDGEIYYSATEIKTKK